MKANEVMRMVPKRKLYAPEQTVPFSHLLSATLTMELLFTYLLALTLQMCEQQRPVAETY